MTNPTQRRVGILLFDDVEVLDFAGPFEVFAVTDDFQPPKDRTFQVVTLSRSGGMVTARNGLRVQPDYAITEHPKLDIIVVPGGIGSRAVLRDLAVLDFLQRHHRSGSLILSVCTGALVLAKAGLLDGLSATTHSSAYNELQHLAPKTTVQTKVRYVDHLDDARIMTSGGISAGIDMALYVVEKLCGTAAAAETVKEMNYDHWTPSFSD